MKKAKKRLDKTGGTDQPASLDKTGGADKPKRRDKTGRANQPERLDLRSMSVTEDQKRKLKQLFPEVFVEKKISWEKLKATLGEEVETGQEFYDISWQGKRDCFRIIQEPSLGALKPCKKESLDWANTQNLFIEGNNLEVLKLLQKSYYEKVKMIYIDLPYNTGKDFIYPDKYSESLETYLQYTGQKDSSGQKFSTNQETDGRFHSNWLNMMYPRLSLASNLLRDDGVIFISIDDNEVANLRKICDDIFGEENFVNIISAKMKNIAGASGGGEDKRLKKNIEFVLVYAKDYDVLKQFHSIYKLTEIYNLIKYYEFNNISWKYTSVLVNPGKEKYLTSAKDGDGNEIKIFKRLNPIIKSVQSLAKEERISQKEIYYKYIDKIFTTAMPQSSIRTRVEKAIDATNNPSDLHSIKYIPKTGKNKGKIYEQFYKGEKKRLLTWLKDVIVKKENKIYKKDLLGTLWDDLNLNNLTKEGGVKFENGKKPLKLLENMISMATEKDSIILDFFAGSGTTAHAVYEKNLEDGGNRRYICVQLPEPIEKSAEAYKAGFKTIADIGKERIRRAVKQIQEKEAAELKKESPASRRGSAGQASDDRQTSLFEESEGDRASLGKSGTNPPDPPYQGGFISSPYQNLSRSGPLPLSGRSDESAPGIARHKAPPLMKRDLGFRVFKLDKSNFRRYDEKSHKEKRQASLKPDGLAGAFNEEQMSFHLDRFIDKKSSEEDLLYEILIKTGFQLTTKISPLNLAGKKVYSIENDALLICLEKKISQDMIIEAAKRSPGRVIFLDRGFEGNDWLKTNAKQTFDSFGVMDFKTV